MTNKYIQIPNIGEVATDFADWEEFENEIREANVPGLERNSDGKVAGISATTLHLILPYLENKDLGALNPFEWIDYITHIRENSPEILRTLQQRDLAAVLDGIYIPMNEKEGVIRLNPRLGTGKDIGKYVSGSNTKVSQKDLAERLRQKGISVDFPEFTGSQREYATLGYNAPYQDEMPLLSMTESTAFSGHPSFDSNGIILIKRKR